MHKTENQRRILTKCPFLANSEKFPRDLAKVQKNLWCWLMYGTKYMLPLQGFFQLVQGFKKYEPKGWFGKRAHPGSLMSYNKKRWEIRYGLMVSMWKMAENGGSWLKLAKTEHQVYSLLSNYQPLNTISLGSSVGACWLLNPKVEGSNPAVGILGFFWCLFTCHIWVMGVMGSNPP